MKAISNINLHCYSLCIYAHILAGLSLVYTGDPILILLILVYIINDVLYHLDITSSYFNYWHFFIIGCLFIYLMVRIYYLNKRGLTLTLLTFYLVVELLVYYLQKRDPYHRLCYEAIVHISIWVSLFLLLLLEPEVRSPLF